MPMMDGFELSKQIRKTCKEKKILQPYIVACTGHVEDMYIKKAWRNFINEVIPKPAKIDVVAEILKECVAWLH